MYTFYNFLPFLFLCVLLFLLLYHCFRQPIQPLVDTLTRHSTARLHEPLPGFFLV